MGTRSKANAADWAVRLAGRVRPSDIERLSRHMLESIDEVSRHRWDAAKLRADALPDGVRPEKIAALSDSFAVELGATGAAAGAAAVAPGIGTGVTLMSSMAELAWFTARAGDLILTIAALHGRPDPTIEERRAWVMAVLIYGSTAKEGFGRAVDEASGVGAAIVDHRIPMVTLRTANRVMSRSLLGRYGSKRGLVAVVRALPVGFGAVIGGTVNYRAIRRLAADADSFFAKLPYSAIDVDAVDVTGRQIFR